jgi:transcriptional regulator with XRE-family HTH domain
MGSMARRRPERLAEKLLMIREKLGLSQNELLRRLSLADELTQAHISLFETGSRAPSLPVLLEYARASNVYLEALVDDEIDLPEDLPCRVKGEGIKRRPARSSKQSKKGK